MHEFEERIFSYCAAGELFPGGGGTLVALSGGGDSVALLHVLHALSGRLGLTLEAAHLNHALRGGESDADEAFCREICETLGVPLHVRRLSPGDLDVRGESLETAARRERREFLRSLADERGCGRIATGHTRDDLAETVLQRLIRGTGPSGLAGILPVSEKLWARPLLGTPRTAGREYLRARGISWREDSSNADTVFFRNRIRNNLMPVLEEQFSPGVSGSIARLAELSRVQEEFLDGAADNALRKCCIYKGLDKILLEVSVFVGYHTVLRQRIVRGCLELLEGVGRDTDYGEIEGILSLITLGQGEMDVTARIRCGVGGGVAAFVGRAADYPSVPVRLDGITELPSGGCIIAAGARGGERVDGGNAVLVNAGVIRKYGGLTVCSAKRGERMVPFGMDRLVRVSDIVSGMVSPRVLRDFVPVVRAGATPVWIPGLRASEFLRLDETGGGEVMLLVYADGPKWCPAATQRD